MKRFIPCLLAALTLGGCVPKLYEWSPDGQWMTVITPGGLRMADAQGRLLAWTIPGVSMATWFADSQRVVVCRAVEVSQWNELTKDLTPEQAAAIADAGERARQFALIYDWTDSDAGKWDQFAAKLMAQEDQAKRDTQPYKDFPLAVAVYVRSNADAPLQKKIPPGPWAELQGMSQAVYLNQVYQVSAAGAIPGRH